MSLTLCNGGGVLANLNKEAADQKLLKKYLQIENLCLQIEKNVSILINSEPDNEQDARVISLLREYKDKSTSGLPEARNVVKAHIKNVLLTSFNIYIQNSAGDLEDIVICEGIRIDELNGLINYIMPFNDPQLLTAREKFGIILYKYSTIESNGRDGAFKILIEKWSCFQKLRANGAYKSAGYEYTEEDVDRIFFSEEYSLSFADKVEIVTQRVYEEVFGLKHIDILAYSDVNEVGFANNGKYVYCWYGKKVWLSFLHMTENEARIIQDRAISFEKHCPQLDVCHPEILVHRGDGARITVTQKPYFSARNLCIRIFNQSNSSFSELIKPDKLQTLIIAAVKAGDSICLQGGLGTGNIIYILRIIFCTHLILNQTQLKYIQFFYLYSTLFSLRNSESTLFSHLVITGLL